MFKFIALVALFGLAAASSLEEGAAETRSIENIISPEGESFHYAYQTSNGIDVASHGDAHVISGSYKYVAPGGEVIELTYTADGEGFHPSGALLPTPPPIPEAIARAVAWNLAHPQVLDSAHRN